MTPRPRSKKNRDLPDNLYVNAKGYYYRHPRTKVNHGMGSDRAQAIAAAKILNQRLVGTTDLVAKVLGAETITKIIQRFRDEYLSEKHLAARTLSETEYRLKRIERELGDRTIESFDLKALSDWLKPLTRETYIKFRALWIDIYKFACAVGSCDRNIAELTLAKAPGERKRKRWTLEQFKATRENAEPWLRVAMDLALITLQRREDLTQMRFDHIDSNRLLVRQHKTGKRLAIKIGAELASIIAAAKVRDFVCPNIIARKPAKSRKGKKDHLFQVLPSFLSQAVADARDATDKFSDYADGERPTLHEIRSLGAHLYREAGYAEDYIQALLGHADVAMTQHYLDGHREEWDEVSAELSVTL